MPPQKKKSTRAPAKTQASREKQMTALAVDLAEKKLLDGTASGQIILHYLKLATTKENLEKEKLQAENELLKAKANAIKSTKNSEELYKNALDAMRSYSGQKTLLNEDADDL